MSAAPDADGSPLRFLDVPAPNTQVTDQTGGVFTCYQLCVNPSGGFTAWSDVACGLPGQSTFPSGSAARGTAALPQGIVAVGTECRQNGIDPVDEGDPLADLLCPLANAPPRIFVTFIRDRHHRADARLAAKPCQQCAQQQLGIDAIGLRPTQAS